MKKCLLTVLALVISLSLCACGGSTSPTEDTTKGTTASSTVDQMKIRSEEDAIAAVLNEESLEKEIARWLDFNQYYSPKFGSKVAEKKYSADDGEEYWKVTLKGSMSGYIGDYSSSFKTKEFTAEVAVMVDGEFGYTVVFEE